MNGKTARMLRGQIGNPGETEYEIEYEIMPGTKRFKSADELNSPFRGVETSTIRLNPETGRKKYQELKARYKAARAGEMFGRLSWPEGV